METCQRDCDQPVTHFYLAATHNSDNPIYNISRTRTAHAALFFCPAQNPITRQCQPRQTNAKARKRAAACPRCGIDGSEARHITTQEFYRQAIAQQQDLQENIDALLRLEEQKRKAVEQLKQQERLARTEYEQTATLQAQKSAELNRTEAELKSVKGELKGARLKNAAAEVGSNIVEGIGAIIGTSRVKRQQQEIDRLNAENAALHEQIGTLNRANREEKARHEQAEQQLQAKFDRIEHWLPDTQTLISWGEYCRDMGLSESGAREIIAMKPLYVSGELRAPEYSRRFDVSNTEIRLQRDPNGPGGFQLLIDRQPAHARFRQRYVELMTRLGYPVRPERPVIRRHTIKR